MVASNANSRDAVAILMYHEVAPPAAVDALARKVQRGYVSTVDEFEQQLGFLSTAGFRTLPLSALVQALADRAPLPPKSVVITFDDGFEGNFVHARPVLRRYGATATFFVITNRIGDPCMMTWQQLGALADDGFEIGSHTANHPLLSTLDSQATLAELADSKAAIETRLQRRCELLSLPNGDSNEHLLEHVRACGYRGICGSRFGFNAQGADPFDLRRIAIKAGVPLARFRAIVSGDPSVMRGLRARGAIKSAAATLLGKARYDRLYNALYGVDEQDKRRQP